MILNLKEIEVFENIAKTKCVVMDIREAFADLIYARGTGIKAHALALKVFNSDKNTEYTDEEIELIKVYIGMCTPAIIDAINRQLNI